jgi:Phosphotransferase enzyme family
MPKMHRDELEIDEPLVRRLLADQFLPWAGLPLRRVEPAGTDNAIFRLGEEWAVRLGRRKGPTRSGGKEFDWLPRLAPLVPLEIPVPVAQGRPTDEYPWFWDVFSWVEGTPTPIEDIDPTRAARDLASFVAALQRVNPSGAPMGRGIPLAERDQEMRYWLGRFDGDPAVVEGGTRRGTRNPRSGTILRDLGQRRTLLDRVEQLLPGEPSTTSTATSARRSDRRRRRARGGLRLAGSWTEIGRPPGNRARRKGGCSHLRPAIPYLSRMTSKIEG